MRILHTIEFYHPSVIEEFNISVNTVRGFSGDVELYKKFILESDFDIIKNYAAQQ